MALHRRALALNTRVTLVRMVMMVITGAQRLATALATPLAPIQALLAAWRFIHSVVEEWQRFQRTAGEIKGASRTPKV